jgi:hypothetical protein
VLTWPAIGREHLVIEPAKIVGLGQHPLSLSGVDSPGNRLIG